MCVLFKISAGTNRGPPSRVCARLTLPSDVLFYFIINNIAQFTKQYNNEIVLSAYRPLTICKLEVQGLDQKTKKCLIKDPFPK